MKTVLLNNGVEMPDMACKLPETEPNDLKERIESRNGLRQLSCMKEMKMGNDRYEPIEL